MSNILVFDSGIGGISVVREIKQLMPELSIDYLFDNQFYPYGELEEKTLITRLSLLLSKLAIETKPDLIVIACNSASTIALPSLRKLFDIPIIGVVPAIKPASELSESNVIGLLATQGTITRKYIKDLKETHASDCELISIGSAELVEMAEQSFRGVKPDKNRLYKICHPIFEKADVMILGCTHFPLLKEAIEQVCPSNIVLIDSGKAIAQRVMKLLNNERKSNKRTIQTKTPNNELNYRVFYTKTDLNKELIASLLHEGFIQTKLLTLLQED